jgi:hypothetical protein
MSKGYLIRLKNQEHDWLKEFADVRHITMNSIFRTFVEDLNSGKLLCVVNEPTISLVAKPLEYNVVRRPVNNGDKEGKQSQ